MRTITVLVKAHPKRKTLVLTQDELGNLVVSLGALRSEGEANEALLALLSDYFQVPKTSIQIVKGHTSTRKTIMLPDLLVPGRQGQVK